MCIENTSGQADAENHNRGRVNCYLFLALGYVCYQDVTVSGLESFFDFCYNKRVVLFTCVLTGDSRSNKY